MEKKLKKVKEKILNLKKMYELKIELLEIDMEETQLMPLLEHKEKSVQLEDYTRFVTELNGLLEKEV